MIWRRDVHQEKKNPGPAHMTKPLSLDHPHQMGMFLTAFYCNYINFVGKLHDPSAFFLSFFNDYLIC